MMNRIFPLAVFASVFSFVYYACFVFAYTPVQYYPLLNEISAEPLARVAGPAMGWFTWIVIGSIAGLVAAVVAYVVPKNLGDKWGPVMSWAVPVAVTLWIFYVEKHWFIETVPPG
jgi:hypothetical protein